MSLVIISAFTGALGLLVGVFGGNQITMFFFCGIGMISPGLYTLNKVLRNLSETERDKC